MTDFSKDAKIFKALCDTKRLTILDYLKSGEKCACVLIENMNIAESASIGCHPCINSSTLAIATADILEKFLPAVHHPPILVDLPDPE